MVAIHTPRTADVIGPGASGVAATDTAALQDAIDATPSGGSLFLPSGTFKINAALSVSDHITIVGSSSVATQASEQAGGTPNGPSAPYMAGTVLEQQTAATDVLQLSGSAISANIRNLGLGFADAIRHTDTGHGITCAQPIHNTGHDLGPCQFLWENVIVYGNDGDHYACYLLNQLYGTISHFRSFGGGGICVECDSHDANTGNTVFLHTYVDVFNSGSADAYCLKGRSARGSSTGVLNLLTFVRPQVNITGAAATASTQYMWRSNGGANLPANVEIISPNFEVTGGTNPVDTGGPASGTVLRKGGILNTLPTDGADQDIGYQKFTSSGTFTVPDGVTRVRLKCAGAGGGGGGGGSNAAAAANVGGGGGGAGIITECWLDVTPYESFTVTIGAGGTGGAGGAAGGNAGAAGGVGGQSSFGGNVKANGGGGGAGGGASSTTAVGGGRYGQTGTITNTLQFVPGTGGNSQSPNGIAAYVIPPGVVGGGGGGAATAANGGGGGAAATGSYPAYAAQGGGSGGASGSAAGVAGTTATASGCGGGGGGGALTGGAGGDGGAGADGMVEVWW